MSIRLAIAAYAVPVSLSTLKPENVSLPMVQADRDAV
jgi:hypothetical protein